MSTISSLRMRGFTLIEMTISIALVALLGGLTATYSINAFRSTLTHADASLTEAVLAHARSEAQYGACSDICILPSSYGVRAQANDLLLFQGTAYGSRDAAADESFPFYGHDELATDTDAVFSTGGNAQPSHIELRNQTGIAQIISVQPTGAITHSYVTP